MKITKTSFQGLFIIEPDVFDDPRGFFFESYNKIQFREAGIDIEFVQDNQSHSLKNVIRGLHFQKEPYGQAKLMRAVYGTVLDVAVDLRRDQPTFRKVFALELSDDTKVQLLIPKGFAHGFSVLSDAASIVYKCDEYYHPAAGAGIRFDDPELSIDWRVRKSEALLSAKDLILPSLRMASF